jgi:hypothetical protein
VKYWMVADIMASTVKMFLAIHPQAGILSDDDVYVDPLLRDNIVCMYFMFRCLCRSIAIGTLMYWWIILKKKVFWFIFVVLDSVFSGIRSGVYLGFTEITQVYAFTSSPLLKRGFFFS